MQNIGRYCFLINGDQYYNSITHTICLSHELEKQNMLSGQEQDAILSRLLKNNNETLDITLIPSFECNLRCPQCYVKHLLQKPSGNRLGTTDPAKLLKFIERTKLKLTSLYLVGGEPFLHDEEFRIYLAHNLPVGATTNGTFQFDQVKDIIGKLDVVVFSIDGWPELHNKTRRALDKTIDPFMTTYRNLKKTIDAFPDLDIRVQGSIIDDEEINNDEQKSRFIALIAALGIPHNKITLGPCASTKERNAIQAFKECTSKATRTKPCCDYNLCAVLIVYNNNIYHSYHQLQESKPLGTLDDSIETIIENHKKTILDTMPMLHDEICMNECKAVGVCWGTCSNTRHIYKDNKPSSVCDRTYKEQKVLRLAMDKIKK